MGVGDGRCDPKRGRGVGWWEGGGPTFACMCVCVCVLCMCVCVCVCVCACYVCVCLQLPCATPSVKGISARGQSGLPLGSNYPPFGSFGAPCATDQQD